MPTTSKKEWTIMFYFASDNPLAPEIVSQLKAIKQAGFHPEANIVAQFDPHTLNTPTHIFDVNRINKLEAAANANNAIANPDHDNGRPQEQDEHKIGFVGLSHNDPYIVNLMSDKIWGTEKDQKGTLIRDRIQEILKGKGIVHNQPPPPEPPQRAADIPCGVPEHETALRAGTTHRPGELSPRDSLKSFLKFCSDNYPARHYMLFILGHGVVVGNDIFLFDEHASQPSMTLVELGNELREFKGNIETRDGVATGDLFELIGFHSCSMSSLEVACELEGTANFMLASQGPAFVNSWPYRQILIRVFNDLVNRRTNVKVMLEKIFAYCLYNSYDFIVAGYSYEVCLSNLNRVRDIEEPLTALAAALIEALRMKHPLARERILLAHWDAQSYWLENYTDLADFCFRLRKRCLPDESDEKNELDEKPVLLHESMREIFDKCKDVLTALEKETETSGERFIVRSEFAGTSIQYSNGMSVYFPWAAPVKTEFLKEYQEYKFVTKHKAANKTSWFDFLSAYFELTRRRPRSTERPQTSTSHPNFQAELLEEFATSVYNVDGQLSGKPGPSSSTGDDYSDYPCIKNYPLFTREPRNRGPKGGLTGEGPQSISQTFTDNPPEADPATAREKPFLSELL